ncbi:hypothetical protein ACL7TT_09945 [Microbulbifer sp. 2304DJ12-6]|uniref:hypothetical protein n=1 Tax=Microbulbifer sp. 2304DJ12-6 TaxID=3233340 RepID=UPI0039AF98AA
MNQFNIYRSLFMLCYAVSIGKCVVYMLLRWDEIYNSFFNDGTVSLGVAIVYVIITIFVSVFSIFMKAGSLLIIMNQLIVVVSILTLGFLGQVLDFSPLEMKYLVGEVSITTALGGSFYLWWTGRTESVNNSV